MHSCDYYDCLLVAPIQVTPVITSITDNTKVVIPIPSIINIFVSGSISPISIGMSPISIGFMLLVFSSIGIIASQTSLLLSL